MPSASASRSNVALSDSTSASTSPLCTSSPLAFFHSTIVPSSMVSESFGMLTSDTVQASTFLPTVLRTSRLMSSAVGMDAFSSGRLYGIGTCAPPSLSTGASR